MGKQNRIYEKRRNQKKEKSISLRLSQEEYGILQRNVKQSQDTYSNYLRGLMLRGQPNVIPEGRTMLKEIQDIRSLLRNALGGDSNVELNYVLGQMVVKLRTFLGGYEKDC